MPKCGQCGGEGYVTVDEDDRRLRDACYHCGTTGQVDEETAFGDRLTLVAERIGCILADMERDARNADPEGEGFDFCAAENMMTPHDLWTEIQWKHRDAAVAILFALPREAQEAAIAWDEFPIPRRPLRHPHRFRCPRT